MAYSDYKGSQDVLSISSYNSHSDSQDTETADGLNDGSGDFCIEDFMNPEYFKTSEDDSAATAATATATTATAVDTESYPCFDPNDPLRYFLENGEIAPNEYDKWRLIKEEPAQLDPSLAKHKHKRKTPDFGPGYNSDSDPASDDEDDHDDQGPTFEYGYGYSVHADEHTDPSDPWNPTPDTTPDRRYIKIATDGTFMMKRLTQSVMAPPLTLSNSFELKLAWERFTSTQTLQDFWQANALKIYEALQDLRADHARVRNGECKMGEGFPENLPAPPLYHSTPIETLENTFETIGRMSRCIAEDFNTQSVVNYVEEFLVSLYREIEFNALVEAYEHSLIKAEMDIQHQQRQPFSSVFSKEDLQRHIDIQLLKAADPTYRAELMTTDEWLAKKKQQ
jgi:hypothetical protein